MLSLLLLAVYIYIVPYTSSIFSLLLLSLNNIIILFNCKYVFNNYCSYIITYHYFISPSTHYNINNNNICGAVIIIHT